MATATTNSPNGVQEIGRRTYRYVRRILRHVVDYRERIDDFVAGAGAGYTTVVLTDESDLNA